jgi:hypothetical protein
MLPPGIRSGRPEGQGTFEDPSGTRYVGEWRQGKQHGQGVCETVRVPPYQIIVVIAEVAARLPHDPDLEPGCATAEEYFCRLMGRGIAAAMSKGCRMGTARIDSKTETCTRESIPRE